MLADGLGVSGRWALAKCDGGFELKAAIANDGQYSVRACGSCPKRKRSPVDLSCEDIVNDVDQINQLEESFRYRVGNDRIFKRT
jgi:hypothetical protein